MDSSLEFSRSQIEDLMQIYLSNFSKGLLIMLS